MANKWVYMFSEGDMTMRKFPEQSDFASLHGLGAPPDSRLKKPLFTL